MPLPVSHIVSLELASCLCLYYERSHSSIVTRSGDFSAEIYLRRSERLLSICVLELADNILQSGRHGNLPRTSIRVLSNINTRWRVDCREDFGENSEGTVTNPRSCLYKHSLEDNANCSYLYYRSRIHVSLRGEELNRRCKVWWNFFSHSAFLKLSTHST